MSESNQKPSSVKRDRSPTNSSSVADISSKKPKHAEIDKAENADEINEIVETKLEECATSEMEINYLKTSGGPNPDSQSTTVPPPWAQQIYAMLKGLKDDIAMVRSEVLAIQGKLALADVSNRPRDPSNIEAMDIVDPMGPSLAPHSHQHQEEMDDSPIEDSHWPETRPEHADYLEDCFINRIGLLPNQRQEVSITTFEGVLVAKGFNRILPTYQGYFIELEKKDLVTTRLKAIESSVNGMDCWLCPGLSVFRLTQPDNRTSPRAHRFALKPPPNFTGKCNPLRLDKYYIHAYQARFLVGDHSRSLNSRIMASTLRSMFPERYHPRGKDIDWITSVQQTRIPDQPTKPIFPRMNQHQLPTAQHPHKPPFQPTNFMPLPHLPQPYPLIPKHNIQPVPTPHTPLMHPNPTLRGPQLSYSHPTMQSYAPPLTYAQAANPQWQWNYSHVLNQANFPPQHIRQEISLPQQTRSGS